MTSVSEQDEKYIQEQPLETSLQNVRSAFQIASQKPAADASTDETTDVASRRDAISNLLVALQVHPVATKLRSVPSRRPLNRELAFIYGRLDSDDFDLSPFGHLTTLIADEAEDVEIWQAVLQLVATLARTTPPQTKSIPPSFCGTRFTRSSASFQDSNQTRSDLQQPLLTELNGCTFENVTGFFSKYFEKRAWTNQSEEIYELLKDRNGGEPLQDFPKIRSEDQIWDWWDTFQQQHLGEAPGVYCQTKSKKEVQGDQGERQLDLILKHRSALQAALVQIGLIAFANFPHIWSSSTKPSGKKSSLMTPSTSAPLQNIWPLIAPTIGTLAVVVIEVFVVAGLHTMLNKLGQRLWQVDAPIKQEDPWQCEKEFEKRWNPLVISPPKWREVLSNTFASCNITFDLLYYKFLSNF